MGEGRVRQNRAIEYFEVNGRDIHIVIGHSLATQSVTNQKVDSQPNHLLAGSCVEISGWSFLLHFYFDSIGEDRHQALDGNSDQQYFGM